MKRRPHGRLPRTARKELERWFRVSGYSDGYAGRAATTPNAHYQEGWRRGREARNQEGTE